MYINGRASKKIYPNLQKMTGSTPNGPQKIVVCTRCMRTMKKGLSST